MSQVPPEYQVSHCKEAILQAYEQSKVELEQPREPFENSRVPFEKSRKSTFLVAIDGPCGSGKSSIAQKLAEELSANLIHIDDYYLPLDERDSDWKNQYAKNMNLPRLIQEVIEPCLQGENLKIRPYSCRLARYQETILLPASKITILEGSYSLHPLLRDYYDYSIYVQVSKAEQQKRLKSREAKRFQSYEELWIPLENAYYKACRPDLTASLTISSPDSLNQ